MKLLKITIKKKDLLSIPREERLLFIMMGSFLNEIYMFNKLQYMASAYTDDPIERRGRNFQAMVIAYIRAGKLYEGWEGIVKKAYFGSKISKEYDKLLSPQAKIAIKYLKKYFNQKQTIIKFVRNSLAFHYPLEEEEVQKIERLLRQANENEEFEMYLHKYFGNCLIYFSHVLLALNILKEINEDVEKAMGTLLEDLEKITTAFSEFLGDCIRIFLEKYESCINKEEVEVRSSSIENLTIPYFWQKP